MNLTEARELKEQAKKLLVLPRRCQAMTTRRTRCRRRANCTIIHDPDINGVRIHESCELHWEHPPKEWWPR